MKHLMIFGAGLAALGLSAPALAQETTGEAVEALYDVISGPVGEVRDWDRFRDIHPTLPGSVWESLQLSCWQQPTAIIIRPLVAYHSVWVTALCAFARKKSK